MGRDWEDAEGNRITAFLRYVTPLNKGPESTANLQVTQLFMTKATVSRMREGAKSFRQP
jgi:hypothetical protein